MRVRKSEIGSVMLIGGVAPVSSPLPAGLSETWDFAAHGGLAQLGSAQAEFAVHTARSAGNLTAIAAATRAGVARLCLQFGLCGFTFRRTRLRVPDRLFQLRALGGVALHERRTLHFAIDHRCLCHANLCPTIRKLSAERKIESFEQRTPGPIVARGRRDRDIHTPKRIDLIVCNFGKNDLFANAEVVVAATVERPRAHAAKIADTRHRNVYKTIQEFIHPCAA